ncbi:molybdopterin-guanine dinucleotide biosynthesis protein B [Caldalkalibacillus salinus]|uniref:molybdopterin-guanine dinucleotide biosynthesis protein B n=1 Tax=Caldalkalibacillus salinus TaxID=2803787 RepID=UPI00192146FA|nr:molybdopterin-guanine dinucleotide biosynthesis protein B [Caldalkalibacillus salinus]
MKDQRVARQNRRMNQKNRANRQMGTDNPTSQLPHVLQIVGYKNSGKTSLVTSLVRHWKALGDDKISTIKHDVHGFEVDQPFTDTWHHQKAGADMTMIQSPERLGLFATSSERTLEELVAVTQYLQQPSIILVEGFKQASYPKVVLVRSDEDIHKLSTLQHIIAIAFHTEKDRAQFEQQRDHSTQFRRLRQTPTFLYQQRESGANTMIEWIDLYRKSNFRREGVKGELHDTSELQCDHCTVKD